MNNDEMLSVWTAFYQAVYGWDAFTAAAVAESRMLRSVGRRKY